MRKTALKILSVVGGVVVFLTLALTYIVSTEGGLKLILGATKFFAPELSVESVSGTLTAGKIKNLKLESAALDLKIKSTSWDFTVLDVFEKDIALNKIEIDGVNLKLKEDNSTQSSKDDTTSLEKINIPGTIHLESILIRDFEGDFGGLVTRASELTSEILIDEGIVRVKRLAIKNYIFDLLDSEKKDNSTEPIEVTLTNLKEQPLITNLEAFKLPAIINVDANAIFLMDGQIKSNSIELAKIDYIESNLKYWEGDFILDKLTVESSLGNLFAIGRYNHDGSFLSFSGNVRVPIARHTKLSDTEILHIAEPLVRLVPNKEKKEFISAQYKLFGSPEKLNLDIKTAGLVDSNLTATIHPSQKALPFKVRFNLYEPFGFCITNAKDTELKHHHPIAESNPICARAFKGKFDIVGDLTKYDWKFDLSAYLASLVKAPSNTFTYMEATENEPDTIVKASGSGDIFGIYNTKIKLNSDYVGGDISGSVQWLPSIVWAIDVDIPNVNLKKLLKNYPLKTKANFKTAGFFDAKTKNWDVAFKDIAIDGVIQKAPISLKGEATTGSLRPWVFKGVELILGRNKITVNGGVSGLGPADPIHLLVDIAVPGIKDVPGVKGKGQGTIEFAGTVSRPILSGDVSLSGIEFLGKKIDSLKLKGSLLPLDTKKKVLSGSLGKELYGELGIIDPDTEIGGAASLIVKGVKWDDLDVKEINISTQGRETKHVLLWRVDSDEISTTGRLVGEYSVKNSTWKANFTKAAISIPKVGDITLATPARLELIGTDVVKVSAHKWINKDAELQLTKELVIDFSENGYWSGRALLKNIDLSRINEFMPRKYGIWGKVNSEIVLNKDKSGVVRVNSDSVKLATIFEGVRIPVNVLEARGSVLFTPNDIQSQFHVLIENEKPIDLALKVWDLKGAKNIDGAISIKGLEPRVIKPLLSKGEKVEGILTSELKASGTLYEPKLNGFIKASNIVIDSASLPLDLEDSDLEVRFTGNESTLTGQINTKDGSGQITGKANWSNVKDIESSVHFKGEHIAITVPPHLESMVVSPDIEVNASLDKVKLAGEISVESAKIKIEELPAEVVQVSSDEVIYRADGTRRDEKEKKIDVVSNIEVHLGEKARIETFGLGGNLTGDIKVVSVNDTLGLSGKVQLKDGRFKAYGQDLEIRKGIFIFTGPVDDPGVEIEAIRNPDNTSDNVIAGIRVKGQASSPMVSIFTDPAKSMEESLSYLLRGEGLDTSKDNSESTLMTQVLLNLGVSQSNALLGSLGRSIGIEGLGVDTRGTGDDSEVVVSGYILPGLQVKYGVGIFDSLVTLTLRYKVMSRLYVEATSGVAQAIDLLYGFDWD